MNIEQLHTFFDEQNAWECGVFFEGPCCDCKKKIKIFIDALEDGFHIEGGAVYTLQSGERKIKCPACYAKNPAYDQETEMYSRVVGYLRPVKNWNAGKKAEFDMRRTFDSKMAA